MDRLQTQSISSLKKTVIAVIVLLCLGSIPFLKKGIDKYLLNLRHCKEFESIEKKSSQKNFGYIKRGLRGPYIFNFLAKPSPIYVLFYNSSPFVSLHASVDCTGVNLKIYSPVDNENSDGSSIFDLDFFTYLSIVSIFLVPLFGFVFHGNRKRSKFLLNYSSSIAIYRSSVLSRFYYIFVADLVLLAIVLIQFFFNGIYITLREASIISFCFLLMLIFQLFLLASAVLVRILKHKFWGGIAVIAVWVITILLINGIIPSSNNQSSQYQLSSQKNNLYTKFEDYTFKKAKDLKLPEREKFFKDILKEYHTNLKKIKDLETGLIKKTESAINENQFLGIFHQVTFLSTCVGEMSSLGYIAYLEFYKWVNSRQFEIAELYINKIYEGYTGKIKETKDINIDCIHNLSSHVPKHFVNGLVLHTAILILFFFLVYFPFKRSLFSPVKKSFKSLKIAANIEEYILLNDITGVEDFPNKLVNIIFKKGEMFDGEISIAGEPIQGKKVFYLPELSTDDIADFAVKDSGFKPGSKSFKELNFQELTALFPEIKSCDVLLLDRTTLQIEPQKSMVILEINPCLTPNYTKVCKARFEGDSYIIKLEKDN